MRTQTAIKSMVVAAFFALSIPAIALAQGGYDPYGRPDYRRDRDYDPYDHNSRYDGRYLRDTIRHLDQLSAQFERDLDRSLDRSRENGSRHEDHLNADTKEFRRAVRDLRNSFSDRNLYRSRDQAENVLDLADHVERVVRHHFYDGRLASEWSQISQDLGVIADAYNLGYNDRYYRDDNIYRGRGSDDDIYRQRRDPNNNYPWWKRLPWP